MAVACCRAGSALDINVKCSNVFWISAGFITDCAAAHWCG
jgi:hypothetical protein